MTVPPIQVEVTDLGTIRVWPPRAQVTAGNYVDLNLSDAAQLSYDLIKCAAALAEAKVEAAKPKPFDPTNTSKSYREAGKRLYDEKSEELFAELRLRGLKGDQESWMRRNGGPYGGWSTSMLAQLLMDVQSDKVVL